MTDAAFDAWFGELEGFSLRAERFDGDVSWLKAAFAAGQAAERERIKGWLRVPDGKAVMFVDRDQPGDFSTSSTGIELLVDGITSGASNGEIIAAASTGEA